MREEPHHSLMRIAFVSSLFAGALVAVAACGTGDAASPGAGSDVLDASTSGNQTTNGSLPCDVDAVLQTNCRKCHSSPPVFGAPMPLMTYADLQAAAPSDSTKKVYERVGVRIHDDASPMPQPPNARLGSADMATLDGWIAAGAPAGTETCSTPEGGAPVVVPADCNADIHVATDKKFTMPKDVSNEYICYGFDTTVTEARHVVALSPRVDNPAIVHHVLLFEAPNTVSSTPAPCPSGGGKDWRLLYGWAPGGSNFTLPPEAGFPLTPGKSTHYVVQVHYNNAKGLEGQQDSSGFDLCTDTPRKYEADVMAFGTQNINIPPNGTLDRTCTLIVPDGMPQIHLIGAMPHMHSLGTTISTTLTPKTGGASVDLGTVPNWDFNTQTWYKYDAIVNAGDSIKTRCAWKNTSMSSVVFGENTENEMCYSFTMYYPKINLDGWVWAAPALIVDGALGGPSTCK